MSSTEGVLHPNPGGTGHCTTGVGLYHRRRLRKGVQRAPAVSRSVPYGSCLCSHLPPTCLKPPPPPHGPHSISGNPPDQPTPSFWVKLEHLFVTGRLSRDEFDYELCGEFSDFPEAIAVEILQKYEEADLSMIKNRKGFLKGILRRYCKNVCVSDVH